MAEAPSSSATRAETSLRYQRLRVPRIHGATLELPPLSQAESLWRENLASAQQAASIAWPAASSHSGASLADHQHMARKELTEMALAYSREVLGVDIQVPTAQQGVVMSGHQPELFHPGVWFKNFALAALGNRFRATPINLVVDSDLCRQAAIRYPQFHHDRQAVQLRSANVQLDQADAVLPYERRSIVDPAGFASFPERLSEQWDELRIPKPGLAFQLWNHVRHELRRADSEGRPLRLGAILAAARHRLEYQFGLRTLELPISHLAASEAFARFAEALIFQADRFRGTYNRHLKNYREIHGIRSRSHPVPELRLEDGFYETGFWIWSEANPQRRGLFARLESQSVLLSDLNGWETRLSQVSAVPQFRELQASDVSIRPKALVTTMFNRLLVSDLFLHGIGGAKYDQLTDVIAADFFGYRLPRYLTLSATMHLEIDFPVVNAEEITELEVLKRAYRFHPERYLDGGDDAIRTLVLEKEKWISQTEPTKQRHDAIERINQALRTRIATTDAELDRQIKEKRSRRRSSDVATSREYSFCLFPESLVDQLKSMAGLL